MAHEPRIDYRVNAETILRDTPGVREAVTRATTHFDGSRERAYGEVDETALRDWAAGLRRHVLANLERYLLQAEERLTANGVEVHWADDAEDALAILETLVQRHEVRRVVKGKSMLSEEIGTNAALEGLGVEVFETDLGEYIIQLAHEHPSHIIAPAIHRSVEDIAAQFETQLGTAPNADPDALAAAARARLREAFLTADMGITGANFVAADSGTVALVENEGNIRISTSVPRVHVAFVGIEKVVPRLADLGGLLPLISRAATGQRLGNYVSLISGPRRADEPHGPEAVHVIFVDNGRSALLDDPEQGEALACIRCGACLNTCPVFRQTGGHPYQWAYSGPIGAVLAPALLGLERAWMLPQASTLCGACEDVCPVRIPLPRMLVTWRQRAAAAGYGFAGEAMAVKAYRWMAARPGLFHRATRLVGGPLGQALGSAPVLREWTRYRDLPGADDDGRDET
ncbi:lactate utilization protein B [Acidihalobacter prosperus]|uniref:L-lactate dehydrogenase, Iron-sulfur cluster-binding subunit YkgF n=1 Tax=Acidihalobacter prosperus TaxID=160660 RepID=A0A1A6C416_9GAMM|nr:lactate utilization protein B [Acidihalobacter prosperus]OBS09285.1 putative L-lactate dehydrogenase, Iron-sulfur cluster-binding subunit YkgF [Acidihalobacter prosperus]